MISLEPYQVRGRDALVKTKRGIVKSPAGSGKTLIGSSALARWVPTRARLGKRKMRIGWIANTTEQCGQADAAIQMYPEIRENSEVTIACYAAGVSCERFDLVILDECHHIAAPEYRKTIEGYRGWTWGLSASPEREDALRDDVYNLIGPIICVIERDEVKVTGRVIDARVVIHEVNGKDELVEASLEHANGLFERWRNGAKMQAQELCQMSGQALIARRSQDDAAALLAICEKAGRPIGSPVVGLFAAFPKGDPMRRQLWALMVAFAEDDLWSRAQWTAAQEVGIFQNTKRSDKVLELARYHHDRGDSHLIIIGKIEHGKELSERVGNSVVIHSKMGVKKRREALAAFKSGEVRTVFATSLADEGLDVPRANVLTMATAGRSAIKAEQRSGRVLRSFQDKDHGVINDFMDVQHHFLLAQSKRRIAVYRKLGYEVTFSKDEGGLI